MFHYRRSQTAGATYFFTVVTYPRQLILCDDLVRHSLRTAIASTRATRPFAIDAWVLRPDHLYCIWTLPPGDADYATRWNLIKRRVSVMCRGGADAANGSPPPSANIGNQRFGKGATGNTKSGMSWISFGVLITSITMR